MKITHCIRLSFRAGRLFLLFHAAFLDAGISTWWKNREAVQAFKDQKYDEALLIYNDLIDKDPYNPAYNYNIGDVLYKQNRYEDAKQAFKRAATHATKNLKLGEYAWYGAGNSCYQLKEWQQAIDMYEESLKLNPSNEQTLHNLKLARAKLMEERLKDMQDKLEKNKDKNKDKKDQDQQSGQDQQDQAGQDSQDSPGDDNKENQNGKQKQPGKGSSSAKATADKEVDTADDGKDSGTEKSNESGKEKGNQQNLDKKDGESDDENDGDQQDTGESEKQGDNKGLDPAVAKAMADKKIDKKGDNGQEQDGSSAKKDTDSGNQLEKNKQNLDDVASQVADQGEKLSQLGDEKGDETQTTQASDQQLDKQEQAIEKLKNSSYDKSSADKEQGSLGAQSDQKGAIPAYKKPELKNQLQELYEAKSSQDERLDSYYANIMKALEGQEENIQRHVIKNRVAEKMVGQHGKNSW